MLSCLVQFILIAIAFAFAYTEINKLFIAMVSLCFNSHTLIQNIIYANQATNLEFELFIYLWCSLPGSSLSSCAHVRRIVQNWNRATCTFWLCAKRAIRPITIKLDMRSAHSSQFLSFFRANTNLINYNTRIEHETNIIHMCHYLSIISYRLKWILFLTFGSFYASPLPIRWTVVYGKWSRMYTQYADVDTMSGIYGRSGK